MKLTRIALFFIPLLFAACAGPLQADRHLRRDVRHDLKLMKGASIDSLDYYFKRMEFRGVKSVGDNTPRKTLVDPTPESIGGRLPGSLVCWRFERRAMSQPGTYILWQYSKVLGGYRIKRGDNVGGGNVAAHAWTGVRTLKVRTVFRNGELIDYRVFISKLPQTVIIKYPL